jgi:hypothetical protein
MRTFEPNHRRRDVTGLAVVGNVKNNDPSLTEPIAGIV